MSLVTTAPAPMTTRSQIVNREDGGVCPDADSVTDLRRTPEITPSLCRTSVGKQIIDEHGAVRDEAIVSNGHQLADKRMGLNPASFPDDNATLDLDKRADKAISPIVQP